METTETQAVQTYTVDPAHSRIGFRVRHLGFTKVNGEFKDYTATFKVDPEDLSTLQAEATIQTVSVHTRDKKRDAHLRSEDFFKTESHPALTFKSSGVREQDGNHLKLAGTLTIRGVSKDVVLDVEYLGQGIDPWGATRVAFEAKTKINRKDYGLNWNTVLETGGVLVSDEVEILLDVQAVQEDS